MRTRIVLFLAALFLSTYTHQAGQTVLIPYGATWKYRMGYSEASNPTNAWRALAYSDSAWLNGQAPIGYSTADPKTGYEATISTNVPPSSSAPNWTSIYFRKTFNIADITKVLSLTLEVNVDDGAVAWINGVEAGRINVADGELSYTNASILAEEQRTMTVTINNLAGLSTGQNVLAIQGFNGNTTSSDFVMESTLIADLVDTDPPVVSQLIPPAGSTNRTLNTIEVFFNEPVTG